MRLPLAIFSVLVAAAQVGLLQAQTKSDIDYSARAIKSSRYWLDIDYVGDKHIGHRLDVHLPTVKQERHPVVLCIYGSAWFSNSSKGDAFRNGAGQLLLDNGFAVVTINHRASTDATFPAQIHDVKAAIRFIRANAASFSIDGSFIGITGWSSGGHLSALAGTTSDVGHYDLNGKPIDLEGNLGAFVETSSDVDAVVDWFGPTDFLIMDECGSTMNHDAVGSPESSLVGGPIQNRIEECNLADPATYVSRTDPPFLIIHGDKDPLVPVCQSEYLHDTMQSAGADSELIVVPGGRHGPGVMIPMYYERMIQFFKAQLNP